MAALGNSFSSINFDLLVSYVFMFVKMLAFMVSPLLLVDRSGIIIIF